MRKIRLQQFFCLGMSLLVLLQAAEAGMIASQTPRLRPLSESYGEMQWSCSVSSILEHGHMTYTIGDPEAGGWKSELEWPLENVFFLGGIATLTFRQQFQLNMGLWKSLPASPGIMKDSDWLYQYYGNRKAIYSESDATVDSTRFDIHLRYNFFGDYVFLAGGMLGYSRTRQDWEVRDGYQWTIDSSEFYQGPLDGLSVTYKQVLDVPYIGMIVSMFSAKGLAGVNGYLLYSPVAKCHDEDDHILRAKLSRGHVQGDFLGAGVDLRWNVADKWSVSGSVKYSSYDLEGDQEQYFYAGEYAESGTQGIDLTLRGRQLYVGLGAAYDF